MANELAIPQCFVDIYPFEGGSYTLQGASILRCLVSKSIGSGDGNFALTLTPGGPFGRNIGPSWQEIITPNSLVVIAMTRWKYRQVLMVGVVKIISESQVWRDNQVMRVISVVGEDFNYYLTSQSYFAWNFLASSFAALLAPQLDENAASLPFTLGLLGGPSVTPAQIAKGWYNDIFAGTKGILANTSFPFQSARIGFPQAMATLFEEYPNVSIPMSDYYIATEEAWLNKFRKILPYPFYEVFAITAPPGFYAGAQGGYQFYSRGLGADITVSPVFVNRVNPLPRVTVKVDGQQAQFADMDVAKWNALPLFVPDASFIESQVSFTTEEARNFYALIPTWYASLYGGSNSNTSSLLFLSAGAVDIASIHRYGYRPAWQSISWFSDPAGSAAKSGEFNIEKIVWDLMTRVYSYFEPAPLMALAATTFPLRPDIMPGCRYRYNPYKGEDSWDFYIDTVIHNFVFGGPSTTALQLRRGFPTSVYADVSENGVLRQAHLGNAMRLNGVYQVGLPPGLGKGLQILPFNSPGALNQLQAEAAQVFVSPQTQ